MPDPAKLIEAINNRRLCKLPSPRINDQTVRVMAYAEGYMMVRHKGAVPFIWAVSDALTLLRAQQSSEQGQ